MFYYRARIPADIAKQVLGQSITVAVADGLVAKITLGTGPVKVSLQTKDAGTAKVRHASVEALLRSRWDAVRRGPVELSHKQVLALAGEWYRSLVNEHEDEPGSEAGWDAYRDACPSADNSRQFRQFSKGGSCSSGLGFKRLADYAASVCF
jgi:hypothetical protein